MTSLTMKLHTLLLEIKAKDPANRFALQSRLDHLIHEMEAQSLPIDRGVRTLNKQLLDEAIEAQFENLPV